MPKGTGVGLLIDSYDRLEDCETVKNQILLKPTSTGKTVFDMICPATTTTPGPTTTPDPTTTTTTSFNMSLGNLVVKTKKLKKEPSFDIDAPVSIAGRRG